jgi:aminoglycoside phosphotransferase (APT) family kinase protein
MSPAEGVSLQTVWPRLAAPQKSSIQAQLCAIFLKLRQIQPSSPSSLTLGGVAARCKDMRRTERTASVAIKTEADFNDFLSPEPRRTQSRWIKLVRSSIGETHQIVMTHGDLHPGDIIVTRDESVTTGAPCMAPKAQTQIRITSILDWELSGWYPEYWEFVKALNTISLRGPM